jgi:hypothetical protein
MPKETKPGNAAHFWVIDDKGLGICKYCGERRQFQNTLTGPQISTASNKLRRDHEYFDKEWK